MSTRDGSDGSDGSDNRTADERALAALFASLVDDAPASEVSPDEVIKLASLEQNAALDQRIKRLKYGRNLLLAAALAALAAIVLPKLGHSSSGTTAASSSEAAAASSSAGSAAAGSAPAAAAIPGVAGGSGTSAASSGGVSSGAAAADESEAAASAPQSLASEPAGSAAASAAAPAPSAPASSAYAASSGVASSAGAKEPTATAAGCPSLTGKALAAARSALPASQFGTVTALTDCRAPVPAGLVGGATLTDAAGQQLTISASKASPGACAKRAPVCSPVPGVDGAYRHVTSASTTIWVYDDGYQVALTRTGGPTTATERAQMIAAGKAVIRALR